MSFPDFRKDYTPASLRAELFPPAPNQDGYQPPRVITKIATDGAIKAAAGIVLATKAGVLALTLPAPIDVEEDGLVLEVSATTANANTITCPSGSGLIEGTGNILTFGGAVADCVRLGALGGKWWILSKTNVTLSGT